jgi:hypothetical protein
VRGGRALGALAALAAGVLACGVKAPPRPPEKAGQAASRQALSPCEAPDGGAGCGGTGAPDGGSGRP